MELPNDIWIEIVKQSKKTNEDIVADINFKRIKKIGDCNSREKDKII
jgi:hypothetical protein